MGKKKMLELLVQTTINVESLIHNTELLKKVALEQGEHIDLLLAQAAEEVNKENAGCGIGCTCKETLGLRMDATDKRIDAIVSSFSKEDEAISKHIKAINDVLLKQNKLIDEMRTSKQLSPNTKTTDKRIEQLESVVSGLMEKTRKKDSIIEQAKSAINSMDRWKKRTNDNTANIELMVRELVDIKASSNAGTYQSLIATTEEKIDKLMAKKNTALMKELKELRSAYVKTQTGAKQKDGFGGND